MTTATRPLLRNTDPLPRALVPPGARVIELDLTGGTPTFRLAPSTSTALVPTQIGRTAVPPVRLRRRHARVTRLRRLAEPLVRPDVLIVLGLLVLAVLATLPNLAHYPAPFVDEGTYVSQAYTVQHGQGLAPYTYWYDHPPLGWVLMAGFTWVTGAFGWAATPIAAGRAFMLVCLLASTVLLYVLGRRCRLSRVASTLAVVAFVLSPLALDFHRLVFLDNIVTPLLLGSFVLALSPRQRLSAQAMAGVCFAAAVLTKETTLLLLPALVVALAYGASRTTRRYVLAVTGSLLVLIAASYVLYATLKGELVPGPDHVSLWDALVFQLSSRTSTGSPFDPASDGRAVVDGWLALDAWLPAVGLVGGVVCLAVKRVRFVGAALLILFVMGARPGYLPYPYVIAMLPFLALAAAAALDLPFHLDGRRRRVVAARAVTVLLTVGVLAAVAAPWSSALHRAGTEQADLRQRDVVAYLGAYVPRDAVLLVTDDITLLLELQQGRAREDVVWTSKLDTDSDVEARFPDGWRDADYVVLDRTMRDSLDEQPTAKDAVDHSSVIYTAGDGIDRIDVMKVNR